MGSLIVRVVTLGCKVNQVESAEIIEALNNDKELCINASAGLEPADVYVLNTCSVTAEADRKSRQYISKIKKLSPNSRIIVVGCSSQNCAEKFNKQGVIGVGGTTEKTEFVIDAIRKNAENIKSILSDRILLHKNIDFYAKYRAKFTNKDKTRAFIKIQDGCDRFCTYCIIPYLRGRSRSIAAEKIIAECQKIDSKEIVLTGIDISDYGKDIGLGLSDLIGSLSEIKARKRLGSLECEIVDDKLLSAMEQGGYCPHFHLSLQSGSSAVLKTMNRHYDTVFFLSKIELIRKYFPLAGITTDVIVGFPTETEDLFEESCAFVELCAFSDIHVFPYSSRRGTFASRKYAPLPKDVVASRVAKMLDIKHKLRNDFFIKNSGQTAPVYFEEKKEALCVGYTPNYIKVYADAQCGDIIDVKLTELYDDGMLGVPTDSQ